MVRARTTADLRLVFLTVVSIFNWTEAVFNKMSLGRVAMLLAVDLPVDQPGSGGVMETDQELEGEKEPVTRPEAEG